MNDKQKTVNDREPFQCPECGLHYRNQEIAKQCEEFCRTNNACSMEITQHAVEFESKAASDEG